MERVGQYSLGSPAKRQVRAFESDGRARSVLGADPLSMIRYSTASGRARGMAWAEANSSEEGKVTKQARYVK